MSYTFTKLFSSITESTIWVAPDPHRICWITMLAMADRQGRVWASIPGLANRARISVEACGAAIESFLGPDHYSRTKDHDGRRIEEIDGGWRLLNHAKYRALQDQETVKEAKRKWWNENRGTLDKTRNPRKDSIQAEAEAEADTERSKASAQQEPSHPTTLPLREGVEYAIKESLVREFVGIYADVDVPRTIQEMRAWCLAHPDRRKTRRGILRFINNWLKSEQEKASAEKTGGV